MKLFITLNVIVLCISAPILNAEDGPNLQQQKADLEKQYSELSKKMKLLERKLADDPDIKKAVEASALKEKELKEASEAVYAEIAEKNPEFKSAYDERNNLRMKMAEINDNSKTIQQAIAQSQADYKVFVKEHPELERRQYAEKQVERLAQEFKDREELKEHVATLEAKKKELEELQDSLYLEIAKISPDFKKSLDERNKLIEDTADAAEKLEEFRNAYRTNYADLRALRTQSYEGQKSLPKAERGFSQVIRKHREDPDLKELFAKVAAKQQAFNESATVPSALMAEKDPEYKELLDQRAELQGKYSELRKALYGPKAKNVKGEKSPKNKEKAEREKKEFRKVKVPPKPKEL